MTEFLHYFHIVLRWAHVVGGFLGLVLFWIVLALPKGTRWHLGCGKAFAWIAIFVGGSAAISALWAVLHVHSFAPWLTRLSTTEAAKLHEIFDFFYLLLLFLGMATLTGAIFGRNVMRHRNDHLALRRTWLPVFEIFTGLSAIWLVAFGVCKLCGLGAPRVDLPWAVYQIPVILGLLGIWGTVSELKFIYGPGLGGREWLYKHVEQMFGTGIAFHTAFAVFGFARLSGIQFEGPLALAPWIVPPAIGFVATSFYVKGLRRSNGDLPKPANSDAA